MRTQAYVTGLILMAASIGSCSAAPLAGATQYVPPTVSVSTSKDGKIFLGRVCFQLESFVGRSQLIMMVEGESPTRVANRGFHAKSTVEHPNGNFLVEFYGDNPAQLSHLRVHQPYISVSGYPQGDVYQDDMHLPPKWITSGATVRVAQGPQDLNTLTWWVSPNSAKEVCSDRAEDATIKMTISG